MSEQTFTAPAGMMQLPPLPAQRVWVVSINKAQLAGIVDETTGEMRFPTPEKKDIATAVLRCWAEVTLAQSGLTLAMLDALAGGGT